MRFNNERYSPKSKKGLSPYRSDGRNQFNKKIKEERSYFHYNNAVYMGDMISYKRNGIGIMLYDEGTSAIIETNFQSLIGHSIFFRQNMIASLLHFKKGHYQIALRIGSFILKLPFYQMDNIPNGNGILIDFKQRKMYHLLYDGGRLFKKIVETNRQIIQRVFNFDLRKVIDIRHENAFKFNLHYNNGIKIAKKQNKFTIGYIDQRNNKEGLCFKLNVNDENIDKFDTELQIKHIQRGFYAKNRLQNYGERFFNNGNYYIGQFYNDGFDGKGLLLYPAEVAGKWVHGIFQDNNLVKMIQMSLGTEDCHSAKVSPKLILKRIHEENYKNWISSKIECIDWNLLTTCCDQAQLVKVTDVVVQKAKNIKQQEKRLYEIQKHFIKDLQSPSINKVLLAQKDHNAVSPETIIINQYSSLRPQALQIEPRSIDNQRSWSKSNESSPKNFQLRSRKINVQQRKLNTKDDILIQTKYQSNRSSQVTRTMTPINAIYMQSFGRSPKGLNNFNTQDTLHD